MVRSQGQRLVRALVLGVVVFLFVGGGTGFAVAATQEDKPAAMAFPQPGASATYTGQEFLVGDAEPGIDVDSLVLTWLPETWVADQEFNLRLTHPLLVKARFRELVQTREAYYDAATGEPVLTSGSGDYQADAGVGCGDEATCQFRYDVYDGRGGPCAVRNALQQGQSLHEPLRVTGYCDYADGEEAMTYSYAGRDRVGQYDAFLFRDPQRPEFKAWFDPSLPFPVRFTSTMSDHVYGPYLGHVRMYDLRLSSYTPGEGEYTRPLVPLVEPGAGPVAIAPRTEHLFDFTGFEAPFGFPDAYAAAAASDDGLRGFLADHPDAYVGEAYSQSWTDEHGYPHYGWFFVAVDGPDWKAVYASRGPVGGYYGTGLGGSVPVFLPPETAGQTVTVGAWTSLEDTDGLRSAGNYYLPRELLPESLPMPADVLAHQRFVENRELPDSPYFGWTMRCRTVACVSLDPFIAAGYQNSRRTMPATPGLAQSGAEGDYAILRVDESGAPRGRSAFTYDRPSYSPLFGSGGDDGRPGFQLAPQAMTRQVAGAWALPGAAAVAGLSFLAVLASALYYFWPALKGAGLGLFSRTRDDELLEHPRRAQIQQLVQAEPGIHFQDLARRLNLGRGNLEHHLRKLVAAGLLSKVPSNGYTCYFPKGTVDRRLMAAAPLLRSEGGRAVLDAVREQPGRSGRELAAALGLSQSTVSYHLRRLEEAGLVFGGGAGVRLSPLGEQAAAA